MLLSPPRLPGRYRLLRDGELAGELEVMALDPCESDLRGRGEGTLAATGDVGSEESAARDRRRPPWLLLVLLALVLADFALTARIA